MSDGLPMFSVLGPLEVAIDGDAVDLGGPKPRALLALLIAASPHPTSVDALVEGVWGEDAPESAANSLQSYVSRLRSLIGSGAIEKHSAGYRLSADRDQIDWQRFDDLVASGRDAMEKNPEVAAERLTKAIGLWRGRPFDGVDAAALVPTVTRLQEGRLSALEDRFEAQLAMGRHSAITGELEAMVVDHPLRERLWGQLMTALYRSGRQGEALRAYQRARMVLGEELGIEPSAELRDIEDLILQQAPELDAPSLDEGAVAGAKLEIEGPEGTAFSYELLASAVSVGRVTSGRGPDIALDDPSVSRLQCTLEQEFGAWWVSDTGSRNGTFLRHKGETSRIDGRVRIDHGDALVVPGATGEWTLVLEDPHSTVRL